MDYSDQRKIFDPESWGWPVHLIGAGGVNNLVGPMLAKMGITELHVWDDDTLEERNCPAEMSYSYRMVGRPKVDAMEDAIQYLMGPTFRLSKHYERVTAETKLSGIVIAGVDSMASRKVIWQAVQNNLIDIPLFIDGRSGGEDWQIFAFPPVDYDLADSYAGENGWLFDDAEAAKLDCGARNIVYVAGRLASEITRIITRFHRDLPIDFYTSPVVTD